MVMAVWRWQYGDGTVVMALWWWHYRLTTNTHSDYTHTTNRHSDYAIIDSNTIPLKNKRIESKNMCAGGDLQGCALAPSGSRIARPKKLFEDARTRCTCWASDRLKKQFQAVQLLPIGGNSSCRQLQSWRAMWWPVCTICVNVLCNLRIICVNMWGHVCTIRVNI